MHPSTTMTAAATLAHSGVGARALPALGAAVSLGKEAELLRQILKCIFIQNKFIFI